MRHQEEQVEQKHFYLLRHLLILFLVTGETTGAACEEPVTGRLLHGFLPAVIADTGA